MKDDGELARFEHPEGIYALRYPAHWEHIVKDEGLSCGFGPRDRDDVGIWLSVFPIGPGGSQLRDHLRTIISRALPDVEPDRIREDPNLSHFGVRAPSAGPGQGGSHWLLTEEGVTLFVTSEFPAGERELWTGTFDRLMASLRIQRQVEAPVNRVIEALSARLRDRFPEQDYQIVALGEKLEIRGRQQVIFPDNLLRQIEATPDRQEELIEEFVTNLSFVGDDGPSAESLGAVRELIFPVLKPASFAREDGPAAAVVHREWLAGLITCYAISGQKTFRFILEKNLAAWDLSPDDLHDLALSNLDHLAFPPGFELPEAETDPLVEVSSGDGHDASRILASRTHDLFSRVLGSPFYAGIPDRDRLILFSGRDATIRDRVFAQLRRDFESAAYPISPEPFLVCRDGIAPVA